MSFIKFVWLLMYNQVILVNLELHDMKSVVLVCIMKLESCKRKPKTLGHVGIKCIQLFWLC